MDAVETMPGLNAAVAAARIIVGRTTRSATGASFPRESKALAVAELCLTPRKRCEFEFMLLLFSSISALVVQPAAGSSALSCVGWSRRTAELLAVTSDAGDPLEADIWKDTKYGSKVVCQGNTLKTWDISNMQSKRVQVSLKSDYSLSPIDTNIELWHTPSYKPISFRAYTEDGLKRPIDVVIETPELSKTVAVYNTGPLEFPFDANIANTGRPRPDESLSEIMREKVERVQGGRIVSYTLGAEVKSVHVLLKTAEVANMKAQIELTQGPNQIKQTFEIFAHAANKNPFYAVIQTPGNAPTTLRLTNQDTVEFPFDALVTAYETGPAADSGPVMGGFMAW